eukprot:360128-Prorocentrum_minimum.AAC.1
MLSDSCGLAEAGTAMVLRQFGAPTRCAALGAAWREDAATVAGILRALAGGLAHATRAASVRRSTRLFARIWALLEDFLGERFGDRSPVDEPPAPPEVPLGQLARVADAWWARATGALWWTAHHWRRGGGPRAAETATRALLRSLPA